MVGEHYRSRLDFLPRRTVDDSRAGLELFSSHALRSPSIATHYQWMNDVRRFQPHVFSFALSRAAFLGLSPLRF